MKNVFERSASLVLVGSFNPAIFHPLWFANQGLLGKEECEAADLEVAHKSIAIFTVGWLRVEATQERFVARLCQDGFESLVRDFVINTFKKLPHTPVKAVGINHDCTFALDTIEEWHTLGHKLVPKTELWDNILQNPGTTSVSVREKREDPAPTGYINVRVEPTNKCANGIYVDVNDHYSLDAVTERPAAINAIEMIEKHWANSAKKADEIFDNIYTYGSTAK
jgi:hypothetical protein